jgi:hypothetical protein
MLRRRFTVEDHAVATGARKNRRKGTAQKLHHATGAFLADLLRAYGQDEPAPNPWVYRSMHGKSFTLRGLEACGRS